MRILFLSQYFFPEQFINNHIAKQLIRDGNEVQVVCGVPNYPGGKFFDGYSNHRRKTERWEGVKIHRVFTIPRGTTSLQLILNFLTYPVTASLRILRLGPDRGDITFVPMLSPIFQAVAGIVAKRVWKIPTVFWVLDIWPDSAIVTLGIRNRLAVRVLKSICGAIYRRADLILVQSDGFHAKIAEFGVPAERIVTLPNCAPSEFRPLEESEVPDRIRAMIPASPCTIMFAGNIGESQDFDTIIEAVKLVPSTTELQIVVVGSGRDGERVQDRVRQEGLEHRLIFLGRHPEEEMPAFFACADAMLVSLRDEEIFALTVPGKVQAYLACGKPIIGSLAGEGSSVIEDARVGLVVPPSAPKQLSLALQEFATMDRAQLEEFSQNARTIYNERYSLRALTSKLTCHLEAVLSEGSQGRAARSGVTG